MATGCVASSSIGQVAVQGRRPEHVRAARATAVWRQLAAAHDLAKARGRHARVRGGLVETQPGVRRVLAGRRQLALAGLAHQGPSAGAEDGAPRAEEPATNPCVPLSICGPQLGLRPRDQHMVPVRGLGPPGAGRVVDSADLNELPTKACSDLCIDRFSDL